MIQSSSIIPQFIFDPKQLSLQVELKIFVLYSSIQINNSLNQKQSQCFDRTGVSIQYKQSSRLVYLNAKRRISFKIQQSCEITFSEQVQKLKDFQGIAADLLLTSYKFCRKTKKDPQIKILIHNNQESLGSIIKLIEAKNHCRELVNGRGDIEGAPSFFVKQILRIKNQHSLKTTIFEGDQLLKEGFRLLHAVGRASSHEPVFANITYNGNTQSDKFVAFVGKGVCFDAGGLCVKTSEGMQTMYLDKHGACSVLTAFEEIVKQKLPVNLTCSIGLVQNFIDARSYRVSDIIKSRKGLTVKIADTDAEGRLVLADAMHWTQQNFKVQTLVQLSTLTYSNIAALGNKYAGMFSNSTQLGNTLFNLGQKSHQYLWRMPVDQQHHQQLQCTDADILSDIPETEGAGGSIAAAFLETFVQKGTQWAHLDMGGVGIVNETGTGWGTMLLIDFIRQKAKQI